MRIQPGSARAAVVQGMRIWLELKDISGLVKALYDFAAMMLATRSRALIGAVLGLLHDICNVHDLTYTMQRDQAQALFLEAAALSYSAATIREAEERLQIARRHLIAVANPPGGMRLLEMGERFSFAQEKITKLRVSPADLLSRADAAQKSGRFEEANSLLNEAAFACVGLGDLVTFKRVLNNQMIMSFQRQDLGAALRHLETMEWVCRELRAEKDLVITLKNQAELLKIFEDPQNAPKITAKTEEAQQIEKTLNEDRNGLPRWRDAAAKATDTEAWQDAIAALQAIIRAAERLGEELEQMQSLLALAECQCAAGERAAAITSLLELESLSKGREPLPFFGQALMSEAVVWSELGFSEIAAQRLSHAAVSWVEVNKRLPETLFDPKMRDLPRYHRQKCLAHMRALGDNRVAMAEWASAEKIYRLTVQAGKECLTAAGDDVELQLTHACNLDELGVTNLKGSSDRRGESLQLVREALAIVEGINQEGPSDASYRAVIHQEIADHLRDLQALVTVIYLEWNVLPT